MNTDTDVLAAIVDRLSRVEARIAGFDTAIRLMNEPRGRAAGRTTAVGPGSRRDWRSRAAPGT